MKPLLASLVLLSASFAGGAILGIAVNALLLSTGGSPRVSAAVGTTVFMLSAALAICYGQLLPGFDHNLRIARHDSRFVRKARGAAIRMGAAFGLVAGAGAMSIEASDAVVWTVAITMAMIGSLIGRDFKRRVFRRNQPERVESDASE